MRRIKAIDAGDCAVKPLPVRTLRKTKTPRRLR
jgi:hypothetical protein